MHMLTLFSRVLDLDFDTLPGGTLGVNYCGRSVSIRISHVGIPAHALQDLVKSASVQEKIGRIR